MIQFTTKEGIYAICKLLIIKEISKTNNSIIEHFIVYHENKLMQASSQVQGSNCRIFLVLVSQ